MYWSMETLQDRQPKFSPLEVPMKPSVQDFAHFYEESLNSPFWIDDDSSEQVEKNYLKSEYLGSAQCKNSFNESYIKSKDTSMSASEHASHASEKNKMSEKLEKHIQEEIGNSTQLKQNNLLNFPKQDQRNSTILEQQSEKDQKCKRKATFITNISKNDDSSLDQKLEKQDKKTYRKKGKKKKNQNSPFHNFQKHLNNTLQAIVKLPPRDPTDKISFIANLFWSKYLTCKIKNRKILHFVFDTGRQETKNEQQLRTYGFWPIYEQYSEEDIIEAKLYLNRRGIMQITPESIMQHLQCTNILNKDRLLDYTMEFRRELEEHHLSRRIKNYEKDV